MAYVVTDNEQALGSLWRELPRNEAEGGAGECYRSRGDVTLSAGCSFAAFGADMELFCVH